MTGGFGGGVFVVSKPWSVRRVGARLFIICLNVVGNVKNILVNNMRATTIVSNISMFSACVLMVLLLMSINACGDDVNLNTGRADHVATILQDGKVLIIGGKTAAAWNSVELYNSSTKAWSAVNPMITPRGYHTATLLPNGKVLVVGGYNGSYLTSAELYDPTTGSWTPTSAMSVPRAGHTATLLPNGKVLVAAGFVWPSGGNYTSLSSAEIYDPSSGSWTMTGSLNGPRGQHGAVLLASGKVLVACGTANGQVGLATAELYDPTSGNWTVTGAMTTGRVYSSLTLLNNGKALVTAGYNNQLTGIHAISGVELYDPVSGAWSLTGSLPAARYDHRATLLPDGRVLVSGGRTDSDIYSDVAIYNPVVGTWTSSAPMKSPRTSHTATLLSTGKILLVGGETNALGDITATTECYSLVDNAYVYSECQDLTDNQMPANWFIQSGTDGPGYSFSDGRLNAYQIDGGCGIERSPYSISGVAKRVTLAWTSYLTPIYWGMASAGYIAFDRGGSCCARSELKLYLWGSDHAAYFSPNGLNWPISRVLGESGSFRNTLALEKGVATFEIRRLSDGSLFNSVSTNDWTLDPALASTVTYSLRLGTTTGANTWVDDICIEVEYESNITAPVITGQPADQIVVTGNTASFHVNATGGATLGYQWYLGSTPLVDNGRVSGANSPDLSISSSRAADEGNYRVIVTNSVGGIASQWAALTLIKPPTIISNPVSQSVSVGTTAIMSVSAIGSPPLFYQWCFNGADLASNSRIVGTGTATLTVTNLQLADAGKYTVVVTNAYGSVTSAVANLTVNAQPGTNSTLLEGCLAWWRADYDAQDEINGFDGTLAGKTTYKAGKVGCAFSLSGSVEDRILVTNGATLSPTNGITIEAWIKPNDVGPDQHIICTAGGTGPSAFGHDYYFRIEGGGWIFSLAEDWLTAPAAVPIPGVWYHVAATYSVSEGVRRIYTNGVIASSSAFIRPINTGHQYVVIGQNARNLSEGASYHSFNGLIDELAVYDRALSSNEVAALFNTTNRLACIPSISNPRLNSNGFQFTGIP